MRAGGFKFTISLRLVRLPVRGEQTLARRSCRQGTMLSELELQIGCWASYQQREQMGQAQCLGEERTSGGGATANISGGGRGTYSGHRQSSSRGVQSGDSWTVAGIGPPQVIFGRVLLRG